MSYNLLFRYGKTHIIIFLLSLFLSIYFSYLWLLILAILYLAFVIYFFRNPEQNSQIKDNVIVSPTYGTIKKVIESDTHYYIIVFLSPFDPHVQYIPVNSKVIKQKYHKGEFHPAYLLQKSKYNERFQTVLLSDYGIITITQIAGILARRIVKFVKTWDNLNAGMPFGMIKFGSRVDIVLPKKDIVLACKEGDYLNGTHSAIAKYKKLKL